jgi:hypothetical protein
LIGALGVFLTLVFIDGSAFAQDADSWLGIGLSGTYTDNIDRLEEGGRDESIWSAFTEFEVSKDGRRYDLLLDGLLDYRVYENDTADDEFRGNAFGELIFDIVNERLQWVVQDNFGQVRQNVALPDTPDNRENLNVFRTGPRVDLRLGQRNSIILQGFYQRTRFEDSLQNSEGLFGFLAFEREVSPQSNVSLNVAARRIEFDEDSTFSSYDLQEAYLGWESLGARTRVEIEAGYTELHDIGDVEDGHLFRLFVTRNISQRSALTLDARSELTTTEDTFRFEQQLRRPDLTTQALAAEAEPFRFEYAGLAWATGGNRLWLDAEAFFESREFTITSANDRDRAGLRLELTRQFTENVALGIFGTTTQESFEDSANDFDENTVGLRMDYRPSRRTRLTLILERIDRDTDVENLAFTEQVATLTFTFDVFGERDLGRDRRLDR